MCPSLEQHCTGRIVPTNNRYRAGVLQSALQKSRIDRATTRPTAERELELSTGTGLYGGACRSTLQCCLAVSVV
jgi:hypothetical protein